MDDNSEPPPPAYPLARSDPKLSKTPSWVMLGFVLGALAVYAMMRNPAPPAPPVAQFVAPPVSTEPRSPPLLTTIEAVFEQWGAPAVWHDDKTEVALWNKQERQYADFFEVRRIEGVYYFRSIPQLTRRVIRHGKEQPGSPLQFTETEEQYREWVEYGRRERPPETVPPLRPPPPPTVPRPGVAAPRIVPEIPATPAPTFPPAHQARPKQ